MIFDTDKGLENRMSLFEIGEQGLGMGHAHNLFSIYIPLQIIQCQKISLCAINDILCIFYP